MKLRPLLILMLFVLSAGVLVWMYYAATRDSAPHDGKSETSHTITVLDSYCRRMHAKSVQYDHFADIATEEQHPGVARLFRAMAHSERLHEHNCASAIVRLGGRYTPPAKVVAFRGTTDSNLERSIAHNRRVLQEEYRPLIDQILGSNNRYAGRALIWAAAGELRQVILMELAREELSTAAADVRGYLVCPVCGNLYGTDNSDHFCPFCLADSHSFIRFE